MLAPLSKFLS